MSLAFAAQVSDLTTVKSSMTIETTESGSTCSDENTSPTATVREFHTIVKKVHSEGVDDEDVGSGLYATKDFPIGAIVMHAYMAPENIQTFKTMHSIQVGENEMWDCHNESDVCMLMHAYNPNCMLRVVEVTNGDAVVGRSMLVIARRHIQVDEPLTLNYNSFEFGAYSCPFTCFETGRRVDGFNNAEEDEKEFLLSSGLAFPHIVRLFAASNPSH
jgi:hypothetical protein